jgi:hypothetical protein
MYPYLAVDITGHDIIGAAQSAEWLGAPGIIGALLGLAAGYLIAKLVEEKMGDPSSIGCIYWPVCAVVGVFVTVWVVNAAAS